MEQWLETKTGGAIEWVATKFSDLTAQGVTVIIAKTGSLIVNCEGLFIIAGLIGVYFMLAGNRKTGTKITSTSILLYLLGVILSNVS
ncbi:MAG: hypothetical protein K0Q49_2588 [Haloplasmataceae bacterium]|jgi:hypothetical protein|nr:hypothetical protein [Haloplasmataceae bacterium]